MIQAIIGNPHAAVGPPSDDGLQFL